MNRDWITTTELSEILGISSRALRKNINKNKYVARKSCKRYEIQISSLDEIDQEKIYTYFYNSEQVKSIKEYSEDEKKLALSKFDIVMKWRQFCIKNRKNKRNTVKDFLLACKALKIIGKYGEVQKFSVSTLFRWNKILKENNDDWRALLNKYKSVSKNKVMSKMEQDIFLKLLLDPKQTNVGKAIKITKYALQEKGIYNVSSDMTYRRFAKKFMEEHYDLWVFSREGSKALKDKVMPYIERDISKLNVGDVIVGDGHRLAFQVINPFTGKPCRPMLVAYQDWKSGAMLGFEIMIEENTQCIASALRNSIIALGKYPKYVYQDNGKAFKSKYFTDNETLDGVFIRLGIIPIFAKPYNAKAKIIERFFREMQDSFERLLPSFVGSNIDNKPAYLKRNEKFHKEKHNNYIPTIAEIFKLLDYWLKFHYSQPCPHDNSKTIGEVFESGKGSGVDISLLDNLMMATEIKTIGRNGIRFLNSDYYDESLYGLKIRVIIKYSLFDLSQIKVYDTNGKFLCVANRLEAINPLANYIGEAKDVEDLKQRLKQQKKLEEQTANAYLQELKRDKLLLPTISSEELEELKTIDIEDFDFGETELEENKTPVFHNRYERYDYLKTKIDLTEDERIWIKNYKSSKEYGLIYGLEDRD